MEDDKSANQPMDEKEDNDEDLAFGEEFEDASLQKAAEDTKKAHEFLAKMQARHEKDPEGVAAQFKSSRRR